MGKNKVVSIMLVIIIAITLIGVAALVIVMKYTDQSSNKEPSIDQVLAQSVDIEEMTTNLKDDGFVRISFKLETDSKKAKEELEKRDFQVKNIVIEELSEMKAEQLQGKKGKEQLESTLKMRLNEIMQEGTVVKVYITSLILQ